MSDKKEDLLCNGGVTLIFPCSGAADVGEISDKAARDMTAQGLGKMFCLAGIGGNIKGIINTAKDADQLLVIDGCELDCAKQTLKERNINNFSHFRVTDLGMKKSQSPATQKNVGRVIQKSKELLS